MDILNPHRSFLCTIQRLRRHLRLIELHRALFQNLYQNELKCGLATTETITAKNPIDGSQR